MHVQVRDGLKPTVDGSRSLTEPGAKKDEPGSPTKTAAPPTMPQCHAAAARKTDFVAELSSQLAALQEAASRYGAAQQADAALPPAKCRKQQPSTLAAGPPHVATPAVVAQKVASSPIMKPVPDSGVSIDGTAPRRCGAAAIAACGGDAANSGSPARQLQQRVSIIQLNNFNTYAS